MSKKTIALAYTRPADALGESEYQALVEALSETARGRGFLAEHARRSRGAETNILLTAIERIEAQVRPRSPAPEPLHDDLRRVLDEVRAARARVEAGGAAPKLEQLAALLDLVQRRLTTLLAPPPAAGPQPAPRPVKEIAPATPPRPAAARWLEEPLTPPPAVNDTGPPQRPAIAEAAASPAREIEAEIQAMVTAEVHSKTNSPSAPPETAEPAPTLVVESADDALAAIMALSEEERIALFT
jgi:hypothetical protein